ncbi:right-handed parallel beta-helix repeat-containing protein [Pseudomonas sp. GBPI_506]|uniref:right-handed parallel beta-helix repeat-containing protein n=1 Tax=Pseudomonas sp. GBPI_506 TaxID=1735795 RepID=UPI0020CB7C73|nr:right-handed parallel beta-helix repeat-containing protein [Pseudomonas sp. GBPI_506]
MTVSTIGSVAEFDTNGVTTNYPFYFKFLANEDLVVTYVNPAGVSSVLTLGTNYTVNGAGNEQGGSIVTTSALAGPGQLIVSREMDAFQQTSLRNQGKFLAETHEDVFDKLTMLIQQGFSIFKRALTRPFGRDYFYAENRRITDVKDPVEPHDAANKLWSTNFFTALLESVSGLVNTTTGILYDAGTLFDYLKYGLSRRVDNVAALRLLSSDRNQRARTLGYYAKGDKGGGDYYVDQADTTSEDNGITVIVGADGARWKLVYRSLHIKQAGAVEGTDVAPLLNTIGAILYADGGDTCKIVGTYKLGQKVNMYPSVTLLGGGAGRRNRLELIHGGTAFETFRPAGYTPGLCLDSNVKKLTIVGMGTGTGVCFSIRNAMQCTISKNEIANFGIGFVWNSGHTPSVFVQSFLNEISHNIIKPCGIGHYFGGAANRNKFENNSISDNQVAYDFSQPHNWSETNTFTNENVEGCHSWAEWSASVYSQTWEGLTIENPSTNGYMCLVKDPGRQVMTNLSLIPLGDNAAISKYNLNSKPSMILGSAGSSGDNRLGVSIPETLDLYDIIQHHTHHASGSYAGTINAGAVASFDIALSSARINDRVDAYALRSLSGCIPVAWAGNGVVHVNISNPTTSSAVIPSTEISVILKRAF